MANHAQQQHRAQQEHQQIGKRKLFGTLELHESQRHQCGQAQQLKLQQKLVSGGVIGEVEAPAAYRPQDIQGGRRQNHQPCGGGGQQKGRQTQKQGQKPGGRLFLPKSAADSRRKCNQSKLRQNTACQAIKTGEKGGKHPVIAQIGEDFQKKGQIHDRFASSGVRMRARAPESCSRRDSSHCQAALWWGVMRMWVRPCSTWRTACSNV